MGEFEEALKKYQMSSVQHYETDELYLNIIANINANSVTFSDCPDGYLVKGNTLYILEHFEHDSSSKNRKGSKSRSEQGRVNRDFENYTAESGGFHDKFNINPTAGDYITNALDIMDDHIGKIPTYIKNLRSKNLVNGDVPLKVGFYIEDATLLGNYQLPRLEGLKPLFLTQCKQFLDKFETCECLDYCFCASSYGINDLTTLFSDNPFPPMKRAVNFISKASIQKYRDIQVDICNIDFRTYRPRVFGEKYSL